MLDCKENVQTIYTLNGVVHGGHCIGKKSREWDYIKVRKVDMQIGCDIKKTYHNERTLNVFLYYLGGGHEHVIQI